MPTRRRENRIETNIKWMTRKSGTQAQAPRASARRHGARQVRWTLDYHLDPDFKLDSAEIQSRCENVDQEKPFRGITDNTDREKAEAMCLRLPQANHYKCQVIATFPASFGSAEIQ